MKTITDTHKKVRVDVLVQLFFTNENTLFTNDKTCHTSYYLDNPNKRNIYANGMRFRMAIGVNGHSEIDSALFFRLSG